MYKRGKSFIPRMSESYRAFWFSKSHILQSSSLEYKGKIGISVFAFSSKFSPCLSVFYPMDQFVLTIWFFWYPYWHRYDYFDSRIGILYDILCHMTYGIKCHKVHQYCYQKNRIHPTIWSMGSKTRGYRKYVCTKMQELEILIFTLYFEETLF